MLLMPLDLKTQRVLACSQLNEREIIMSFFKRWYIQSYITKIDPTLAKQFLDDIKPGFSQVGEEKRKALLRRTSEIDIYHCNIKVPVSQIKQFWGITEGKPIDANSYLFAYSSNQVFVSFLADNIFTNFVDYEGNKIKKVGQYLIGSPTLKLPALKRPLLTYTPASNQLDQAASGGLNGEGRKLLYAIEDNSDIIFTGKYHIDTGPEDLGALMFFQALMFIPGKLEGKVNVMTGPIPGSDGVTPLSLKEIREVACKPTPKKDKKTKADDPDAEKNIEKGKKTPADISKARISKKQKQDIARQVRKRINQVGDAAFLNALTRAKDLKNTQQVFDFVLNVMPVGQMIEIAIDCAKKFIDDTPDNVVCDMIMRNLTNDDVEKILVYANVNLTDSFIAQSFKNELINKFDGSVEEDPAGFKSFLINQFNNNVGTREIICAMVFASLPAAVALLALYTKQTLSNVSPDGTCGDPLTPDEKELKTVLENPVKNVLLAIYEGVKSHPILSFTKDLPKTLLDQIIVFVDQLIVQTIALMLQEIAYLCEGSSKTDLANALPSATIYNQDINDYVPGPEVYDGLLDFLDDDLLQNDVEDEDNLLTKELVKAFFTDLGSFLTLSEVCVLFGGTNIPGDVNYDLIIEKIFYGLLSLETYEPLKKVINTKQKLINFLDIFGENFDQALCSERIEELTNAKKILSELCKSSDDAYINDLKQKAASDAIDNLLDQEQDLLNDLFDAIKNLTDPEQPEVFCGPEAERRGVKPLLPSFQDPSQMHLAKKHLIGLLSGTAKIFESEVGGFKNALTANPAAAELANMPGAASQILALGTAMASAMGKTYGISLEDDEGNNTLPSTEGIADYFKNQTNANRLVAPKVSEALRNTFKGNLISNVTQIVKNPDEFLASPDDVVGALYEISTKDKQIRYFANYSSEIHTIDGVPEAFADLGPFTARLLFSIGTAETEAYDRILPEEAITDAEQLTGYTNALALTNIFSEDSEISANTERTSPYKSLIQSLVYSPDFFADILERVIVEHAEFITSLDLFQKSKFSQLSFVKTNPCDKSLLDFSDILKKFEDRTKYIECKIGVGKIPTPSEMAHIATLYESLLRVVVINEAMKSFFVFASFGFDNLVKLSQQFQDKQTFYLQYLSSIIENKMETIIPTEFQAIVEEIVSLAAASDTKNDEISFSDAIDYFVKESFKQAQSVLKSKLEKAGYTNHIFSGEFGFEFVEADVDSDAVNDTTILKNLIPAEKNLALLAPFDILNIDFDKKEIIVPTGVYSGNPRLKNGGFFIERGFEVFHNRKERSHPLSLLDSQKLKLIISMLPYFVPQPIGNFLPFAPYLSKGTNTPLGFTQPFMAGVQDWRNIFNIVGYPLELNEEFADQTKIQPASLFLQDSQLGTATDLEHTYSAIQRQLLGGELVGGGVISTFFSDDYPLQRKENFIDNNATELLTVSQRQGRLRINANLKAQNGLRSYRDVFRVKDVFAEDLRKGIEKSYEQANDGANNVLIDLIGLLGESEDFNIDSLLQKLQNRFRMMETYFYRFGEYRTINLLIRLPFDQSQEATDDEASFYKNAFFTKTTFESLFPMSADNKDGEKNRAAFYQAVLERKYFIREEGGELYFKLPLAYQYIPVASEESFATLPTNSEISLDSVITNFAYNGKIAGTLETLFSSLSYVDLLSFVSILVTKTLSEEYPNLSSIFQNTELALKTGIQQALSAGDRENNPNLYENDFNTGDFNSPSQVKLDLLSLFLEGIIKGVANMTDPTWRTPWFLPGPLTPFGIIAKFLDASEDEDDPKSAADKNKNSLNDPNAFECNDDT